MYLLLKNNISEIEIKKLEDIFISNKVEFIRINDSDGIKIGIIKFSDIKLIEEVGKTYGELKKIETPFKFVSREFKKEDTIVDIKGVKIGGNKSVIMAGPCAVEGEKMILEIACQVKKMGGNFLRGGAFKPRTSPYDFQGLGEEGLKYMRSACDKEGLLMVTEVMDTKDIELVGMYTDIFQVGARNMQNYSLLKELGKLEKPILLKRGLSATVKEFLMAAEYIVSSGNKNVILCERGIRTFETETRNTVDINGIALLKRKTHLPIIIDASHGTGIRELVEPVTLGCILAGADGAMLEIHKTPCCAVSDANQTIDFKAFQKLCIKIKEVEKLKERLKCL